MSCRRGQWIFPVSPALSSIIFPALLSTLRLLHDHSARQLKDSARWMGDQSRRGESPSTGARRVRQGWLMTCGKNSDSDVSDDWPRKKSNRSLNSSSSMSESIQVGPQKLRHSWHLKTVVTRVLFFASFRGSSSRRPSAGSGNTRC